MTRVRKAQAQMALRDRVGEQLAELVTDELPEPLISAEMQDRLQDLAMRLQAQGMQLEQYLQMTGSDPEAFSQELRDTAVLAVKIDLALRAVAEAEGIDCSDDDLDEEIEGVAERVGQSADEVRARFERVGQISAIRSDIKKRKALDWLLERGEVVDPDRSEEHTSELQSLMRRSYDVFCLKKKKKVKIAEWDKRVHSMHQRKGKRVKERTNI